MRLPPSRKAPAEPESDDILVDALGQIGLVAGDGKGHRGAILIQQLYEFIDHDGERLKVLAADLEGRVDKHFRDVVVAREEAAEESIERVEAADGAVV